MYIKVSRSSRFIFWWWWIISSSSSTKSPPPSPRRKQASSCSHGWNDGWMVHSLSFLEMENMWKRDKLLFLLVLLVSYFVLYCRVRNFSSINPCFCINWHILKLYVCLHNFNSSFGLPHEVIMWIWRNIMKKVRQKFLLRKNHVHAKWHKKILFFCLLIWFPFSTFFPHLFLFWHCMHKNKKEHRVVVCMAYEE